jgi:hypothetical protein
MLALLGTLADFASACPLGSTIQITLNQRLAGLRESLETWQLGPDDLSLLGWLQLLASNAEDKALAVYAS